ncbi:MAG: SDR family NAD(P)-dependent oxidoreductase [Hyphomicrobiales bacterium]
MSGQGEGRVAGKVALITGGARNMGLSHGRLLASHGARVILADLTDDAGERAAAELRGQGLDIAYIHLDVTRPADWQRAMQRAEDAYGGLDILVNNAAILGKSGLLDCSLEEWSAVIDVNQTGTFLGIRHAAPLMRKNGAGSIINISSVIGNLGTEFNFAYSVSKAAVLMLTKAAAVTLAPQIRVNTIIPGGIDTDMLRALPEEIRKGRLAAYPMSRAGRIEEVSQGVLFLASDESSFTTGGELKIDGGALAGAKLQRLP